YFDAEDLYIKEENSTLTDQKEKKKLNEPTESQLKNENTSSHPINDEISKKVKQRFFNPVLVVLTIAIIGIFYILIINYKPFAKNIEGNQILQPTNPISTKDTRVNNPENKTSQPINSKTIQTSNSKTTQTSNSKIDFPNIIISFLKAEEKRDFD